MGDLPRAPRGPSRRAPVAPQAGVDPTVEELQRARPHFPRLIRAAAQAATEGRPIELIRLVSPIIDSYPTAVTNRAARVPELPAALELLADEQLRTGYPRSAAETYAKASQIWTMILQDLQEAGQPDRAGSVHDQLARLRGKQGRTQPRAARNQSLLDRLTAQDRARPGLDSIRPT